jgi:hypothetical protein
MPQPVDFNEPDSPTPIVFGLASFERQRCEATTLGCTEVIGGSVLAFFLLHFTADDPKCPNPKTQRELLMFHSHLIR